MESIRFKDGTIIISEGKVYIVSDGVIQAPIPVWVIHDLLVATIEEIARRQYTDLTSSNTR